MYPTTCCQVQRLPKLLQEARRGAAQATPLLTLLRCSVPWVRACSPKALALLARPWCVFYALANDAC